MENGPKPGGAGVVVGVVAMGVCCAIPLLLATGGIGAISAWLFDGGAIWLLIAAILLLVAGRAYFRRKSPDPETQRLRQHDTGRLED